MQNIKHEPIFEYVDKSPFKTEEAHSPSQLKKCEVEQPIMTEFDCEEAPEENNEAVIYFERLNLFSE